MLQICSKDQVSETYPEKDELNSRPQTCFWKFDFNLLAPEFFKFF
jgi:hypothetical protein